MKIQYRKIGNAIFHGLIVINLVLCFYMMMKYFFFKDSKPIELGNVSDWISAACNIVMAGAALYAAKEAKKWFKRKKIELGHSSAKNLFLTFFKMNPALDNLSTHIEMFHTSAEGKGEEEANKAAEEADKDISHIEKLFSEFFILIADYEQSIFELNGLGWSFKDKFSDICNLPIRVDIFVVLANIRCEEVCYRYDLFHDHENLRYSASSLESSVKELLCITKQYNNEIAKILNENLQYELYFKIDSV